jgi:hypothetical protein
MGAVFRPGSIGGNGSATVMAARRCHQSRHDQHLRHPVACHFCPEHRRRRQRRQFHRFGDDWRSGGGGGDADVVNVTNGGTLAPAPMNRMASSRSIGGGGGSGGSAVSIGAGVPVAIGGQGAVGGDGGSHVTALDGSQITTDGDRSHAIFAQSVGGGGGNGGFAISVGAEISATISIGGSGARGGDADDVTIKTAGDITPMVPTPMAFSPRVSAAAAVPADSPFPPQSRAAA